MALQTLPLEWLQGRQASGYDKASLLDHCAPKTAAADVVAGLTALLGSPPGVDAWWIVYPPGSGIPPHTDPVAVDGYVHVRANLVVSQGEGGVFVADGVAVALDVGDVVVFRPDSIEHAVTTVVGSARHVVSVGTLWPEAEAATLLTLLGRAAGDVAKTTTTT